MKLERFFGGALIWLGAITGVAAPAQTFTTLAQFEGKNGYYPAAGLIQGTNGDFYGTTAGGGSGPCEVDAYEGCGTIFKITPGGRLTTFHRFSASDGAFPAAALVLSPDGDFYGTTQGGGENYGTVFKITPQGVLTTLHTFSGADGAAPATALILGTSGNFYGTTGGVSTGGMNDYGTIFKMTPGGILITLHTFALSDGGYPSGLIQATDGNFYGTTYEGGVNSYGTIFRISPGGALTTLYSFSGSDGASPLAGLVQGSDGKLYGDTYAGGAHNDGTIFEITLSGVLATLYNFSGSDGAYPAAGLIQATDGNLYGTTSMGGENGGGTIFEITPGGTLTTLYSFDLVEGEPEASLVEGTNGTFYGTTYIGSTVFSLDTGLGPFVETETNSGRVGAAVRILGTDLTGATSVSFNGTAAAFTVVSASEIATTVPTGATSGTVEVVTPGGTLSSNVRFRVR